MNFQTIDPTTEKVIATYNFDNESEVERKLQELHLKLDSWSSSSVESRVSFIGKVRASIEQNLEQGAQLISQEMGKAIIESRAEIKKCLAMIDFYCANADEFLSDQPVQTIHQKSYITYRPQGIILGIMPWNFPFWQVLRFAVPTLLTGNTVLIKHAPNVQGCQEFLQKRFDEVFKNNETPFGTLKVEVQKIEKIIGDHRIRGVSFTGSEKAGRSVAQTAAKYLKKTVLELGGSDPYLVLEDADIEKAANACVTSRFINNGQSCVAAKRWIVAKSIMKNFEECAIERIKELKLGNPLQEDTQLGPMARLDLKEGLQQQLKSSLSMGATKKYQLETDMPTKGYFFAPTLITNVTPGQPAFGEELFGPVACIIEAKNDSTAIELANQSSYGLGGAVFSQDIARAEDIAKNKLDTGGVFINDFYKSVPELPFGGVKSSGIGRELSKEALYEFANIKTIAIP